MKKIIKLNYFFVLNVKNMFVEMKNANLNRMFAVLKWLHKPLMIFNRSIGRSAIFWHVTSMPFRELFVRAEKFPPWKVNSNSDFPSSSCRRYLQLYSSTSCVGGNELRSGEVLLSDFELLNSDFQFIERSDGVCYCV